MKVICSELELASKKYDETFEMRIISKLNSVYMIIMEYIPSITLRNLDPTNAKKVF